jgi:hypothetical protein
LAKKEGVTLTGIETINGKDTYAIKDGKTNVLLWCNYRFKAGRR